MTNRFFRRLKTFVALTCSALLVLLTFGAELAFAGTFSLMSDSLSDAHVDQTGVTHTIGFTTATTDGVQEIQIQFSTASNNSTKPAGLDLTDATLGLMSNLGSGWSLNTSNAISGLLIISRATSDSVSSGLAASIQIQDITNSSLGACISNNDTLTDTCWVTVRTYSDTGTTLVDNGTTTYQTVEDPSLTFEITPVSSGQTHNGITTDITTTTTSLPFGRLTPGQVKYGTHQIKVTTNAPHGYTVYAYLNANITGVASSGTISPFGATNATWSTPQLWETPTGTVPNTNTGWFAANTTDTRVSGWSSASQKFGPISTIPHPVAYSATPDRSGTTVYVTYALGVNGTQPSDLYTGNIIYDVQATY